MRDFIKGLLTLGLGILGFAWAALLFVFLVTGNDYIRYYWEWSFLFSISVVIFREVLR